MTWQNSTHSQIQNHCQIGLMKLAMAGKQTECVLRVLSARLGCDCWDFVFTKSADDRKINKQKQFFSQVHVTNLWFVKVIFQLQFKWKINLLSEIWSEICIVKKCECSENVVRSTRLASMGQKHLISTIIAISTVSKVNLFSFLVEFLREIDLYSVYLHWRSVVF